MVGSRVQRVRECHSAQQREEIKLQERIGLARSQHNGASGFGDNEFKLSPGRGNEPQ